MSLMDLVRLYTVAPTSILGLDRKGISVGADARLTVVECGVSHKIDASKFKSKGKNTPFDGDEVFAKIVHTVHNDKIISQGE